MQLTAAESSPTHHPGWRIATLERSGRFASQAFECFGSRICQAFGYESVCLPQFVLKTFASRVARQPDRSGLQVLAFSKD